MSQHKSAFGFEKPEDSPGFLLWKTTIIWQRLIKNALDSYQISHMQFVIMANILWFEEHDLLPSQISIVNMSKLDKMTVSQSLKKLTAQGLIVRFENEKDTRAKSVQLTTKGRSLTKKLIQRVEYIDQVFFDKVSKSEQAMLIKILNKLTAN